MDRDALHDDALTRLRSLSWDSPQEERRLAITLGEREVPEALASGRWDEVVDLAAAIADAWLDVEDDGDIAGARCREWCVVALDAARALEGEDGGPATIAALERLGRASVREGGPEDGPEDGEDAEEASALFDEALAMAERHYGDEAPEVLELLLLAASATARADDAIELSQRALAIAERHALDAIASLVHLSTALLDAGRAHEAIPYAERALSEADDEARALHMIPDLLAISYEDVGRHDEAQQMRREQARLDGDDDREHAMSEGFVVESLARAGRETRPTSRSKLD